MITVRKSGDRGYADHGWLQSYHTFAFAEYQDPKHRGFRKLRVVNEDHVAPRSGFPMHSHRDMEIISYVVSGQLKHEDSNGNSGIIEPGQFQRMTAGAGVAHSEYNPSTDEPVHLLQIWIFPEAKGLTPSYEELREAHRLRPNTLALAATGNGRNGAMTIQQDVDLYGACLETGASVSHALRDGRHAWIQLISGEIDVNGIKLSAGDGAAISEEPTLAIECRASAELLLFDLN